MDKLEKNARFANLISLIFCITAISLNSFPIITLFVVILALLEGGHFLFGDVTDSYRLLRKRRFLRLYTATLIIFSFLDLFAIFILENESKVYFLSVWFAFFLDFLANKVRVKKLNEKKKIKKKTNKKQKF